MEKNPDIKCAKVNPLLHYLSYGGNEGRDPGPKFSSSWYLSTYLNEKAAEINPLVHYLTHGKHKGHTIYPSMSSICTDPIIVHQIGKVGSQTMVLSLSKTFEALKLNVPVYHTHALDGFDIGRQWWTQQQNKRNPEAILAALEYGEHVRKMIDENPSQHWNLVSLVRDPVDRTIAAFFHNLEGYIPGWNEKYIEGKLNVQDVQPMLFLQIDTLHDEICSWFDLQMKAIPAIGIDVYATPFPHDIGYKIFHGSAQASLLLIRLENLNECAESAIYEFLGLKNFALQNTNVADEKVYAAFYHAFKELPLPLEFVEKFYKTRFAQHFYSEVELDTFKKHWTRGTKFKYDAR